MTDPVAGPSTAGRTSARVRNKSQRAIESEDTKRLLHLAKEKARAGTEAISEAGGEARPAEEASAQGDTRTRGRAAKAAAAKGRAKKEKKGGKRGGKGEQEVWCICKTSNGDGAMIECGECNDWFHFGCVNLSEEEAERIHTYVCPPCESSTGTKTTMLYDVATIKSPTPPPGLVPGSPKPEKKKKPATKRKAAPTKREKPSPSIENGNGHGDDVDKGEGPSSPAHSSDAAASSGSGDDSDDSASHDDGQSDSDSGSDADSSVHLSDAENNKPAKRPRTSRASRKVESKAPLSTTPVKPSSSNAVPPQRKSSASIAPSSSKGKADAKKGLPPARQFVLTKLKEIIAKFFAGASGEGEGEKVDPEAYAKEMEAGLFKGFKDVAAGQEVAGARYKTQFNLLLSSLNPSLQESTKTSILTHALSAAQVACLSSGELASQTRFEELEKARRESLQQTVRQKEDMTGTIRLGRDGLERVEDQHEKEMRAIARAEEAARTREARRESGVNEPGAEGEGESEAEAQKRRRESVSQSPADRHAIGIATAAQDSEAQSPATAQFPTVPSAMNTSTSGPGGAASATPAASVRGHGDPRRPSMSASGTPVAVRRASDVPASPIAESPHRASFNLASAWGGGGATAAAVGETGARAIDSAAEGDVGEVFGGDQTAIDLSDLMDTADATDDAAEAMDVDMGHDEAATAPEPVDEMDVLKSNPVAFTRGLVNPSNRSAFVPLFEARLVAQTSRVMDEAQCRLFCPYDTVELTGRIPTAASVKFLAEMRMNAKKELVALALMLRAEADEGQRTAWEQMVNEHIDRDRHALYMPYQTATVPLHAAKEIYLIPLRSGDAAPPTLDLIDGFKLPAKRQESIWVMVVIANREETPLHSRQPSAMPPPPSGNRPYPPSPAHPTSLAPPPHPSIPAMPPQPTMIGGLPQADQLQALLGSIKLPPQLAPVTPAGATPQPQLQTQALGMSPVHHVAYSPAVPGGATPYPPPAAGPAPGGRPYPPQSPYPPSGYPPPNHGGYSPQGGGVPGYPPFPARQGYDFRPPPAPGPDFGPGPSAGASPDFRPGPPGHGHMGPPGGYGGPAPSAPGWYPEGGRGGYGPGPGPGPSQAPSGRGYDDRGPARRDADWDRGRDGGGGGDRGYGRGGGGGGGGGVGGGGWEGRDRSPPGYQQGGQGRRERFQPGQSDQGWGSRGRGRGR